MITLSAKDFEKKYGTQGVNAFSQIQPQSFFQDIKKDLADTTIGVGNQGVKTFNKVMDVAQSPNFNIGQKFMGVTGSILGGASGIFGEAVIGAGKTLLPQVTEDAIKNVTGGVVGSIITPEIAKKASIWYSGLNPDEKLVVDSAGGLGAFMFDVVTLGTGKAATTAVKMGVDTALTGAKKTVTDAVKNSDITVTNAAKLREEVQALVGEKSVGDQVKTSAERLIAQEPSTPNFLRGAASRVEDTVAKYDRYLAQSERAINDIKVDPAISEVGSNMGDAFKVVVAQRRKVGEALGQELKTYGNLRVAISESVDTLLRELKESGLSYNPKTRQLTSFQGSRFADAEVSMLNDFVGRMNLLGKAPTVSQIDNFVARMRAELDFAKGQSGVIGTTNAERIINSGIAALKESLNPAKNGIQQLNEYWRVNQIYSRLSNFVEEGAKYLGKLTQAGDFAKDASIAKSAVQSILNNGKKDWMLQLEKLTGYNALDDAVLALQAMKDAGDYRGLSLLQAMKDSGIPTSKAGFVGAIIDKGVDIGKRVVAGTPAEQTRAFLKSLSKVAQKDLKVADKAVVAGKSVPKTKEIVKLEAKIAENVKAQKAAIKAKDYTLVAKLKEAYDILVTQLKKAIKYLNENGSVGMSIKKTVTPESVAKRADDADMGVLDYVIRDYDNAILDPNVNRTLSDMGLGKATRDERIRFAKEVFDEQAGVASRSVVGTKADTSGGFDGDYLYHGTSKGAFENIQKEGIKPQRRGVTSLSKSEDYSKNWAFPEATKTQGVMLRVKADAVKTTPSKSGVPSDTLNELLTKETIPPEAIEILKDGKWQPLANPLYTEARKYKSAEEFVADVNQTNISRLKQDQNFSFDVDAADFNQWLWKGVPRSGRKYELVYMSPDEYLNLLRTKSDIGDVPAFPNKDIANLMRGGEKMPVPWLEYDKAGKIIGQEGRNRALAAKELGIKEIPVVSEMPTSATSQLIDIWNKANRKASATEK